MHKTPRIKMWSWNRSQKLTWKQRRSISGKGRSRPCEMWWLESTKVLFKSPRSLERSLYLDSSPSIRLGQSRIGMQLGNRCWVTRLIFSKSLSRSRMKIGRCMALCKLLRRSKPGKSLLRRSIGNGMRMSKGWFSIRKIAWQVAKRPRMIGVFYDFNY